MIVKNSFGLKIEEAQIKINNFFSVKNVFISFYYMTLLMFQWHIVYVCVFRAAVELNAFSSAREMKSGDVVYKMVKKTGR